MTEINKKETPPQKKRINETKSWVFQKININIDKSLANLNKTRRVKTQINEIRNKTGEITKKCQGNPENHRGLL
jgi:hypothetical protein